MQVEVLQLSKGEQSRRSESVDAEHIQPCVIEKERILERKEPLLVRVHDSSVLIDIDVRCWPAGRYIRDHHLLGNAPITSEADEQRRILFWMLGLWEVP